MFFNVEVIYGRKKQPEMAGTKIFFSYEYKIYLSSFFQALSQPFSPGCPEKYRRRHERTRGGGNGSFTGEEDDKGHHQAKRAPWPQRGQSPEWCRSAAALGKGSSHNQ